MTIQRNAAGGGKYVSEGGEYLVTIEKVELKKTKAGKLDKEGKPKPQKPMVVIHFLTQQEQEIAGYFVKDLSFHMSALVALKAACGIGPDQSSDELIGKSCGILVEMGPVGEQGRAFAQIVGYGPASEVGNIETGFAESQVNQSDSVVPF